MPRTAPTKLTQAIALHLLGVSPGHIPPTCYVAASNGMFLKKYSPLVDAVIPIADVPHLEPVEPYLSLRITRIPANLVHMAWLFFKWVFDSYHGEAELFLHYDPINRTHTFVCPVQTVSPKSVSANPQDRLPNHQLIGSLHSHCNEAAYHSRTDMRDEKDFDGLHVTMGMVHQPTVSLCSSLVINGHRALVPPEDFMEGILSSNGSQPVSSHEPSGSSLPNERRYCLDLNAPRKKIGSVYYILGDPCEFPEEWKSKVTPATVGKKKRKAKYS